MAGFRAGSGAVGAAAGGGVLGVRDLPAAVAAVGLQPGDPVFVRPDFVVDPELLEFALSSEFHPLERETRRNYALDIRLLLTWLWRRGIPWRRATESDLRAYREFRCDSPLSPSRISGTKWDREASAFTRLYRWAKVTPLPVDSQRRADRAADARSSRVSWLTPRTWGLWQDVGLRGSRSRRDTGAGLGRADRAAEHLVRRVHTQLGTAEAGIRRHLDVRSAVPPTALGPLLPRADRQSAVTVEARPDLLRVGRLAAPGQCLRGVREGLGSRTGASPGAVREVAADAADHEGHDGPYLDGPLGRPRRRPRAT